MHHRPFNVEMHKRAQSDVDVTAGNITSEVRKKRNGSCRNSKYIWASPYGHMKNYKMEKSTSN